MDPVIEPVIEPVIDPVIDPVQRFIDHVREMRKLHPDATPKQIMSMDGVKLPCNLYFLQLANIDTELLGYAGMYKASAFQHPDVNSIIRTCREDEADEGVECKVTFCGYATVEAFPVELQYEEDFDDSDFEF